MGGLIFFSVVGLWLWLVYKFSTWIGAQVNSRRWRALATGFSFLLLMVLPLGDEIFGRLQFNEMCRTGVKLRVDAERVRGRTLRLLASQSHFADAALPIEQWDNKFVDVQTGEELASYRWMRASGGILARTFLDGGRPLSFGSATCAPALSEPIEKQYGFTLISK
jgi:hypothetical protein